MKLKNNFLFTFYLISIIAFSQKNEQKKIKEEYIEKTSNTNHKTRWFNTFNSNGEIISDGDWEYSKDSTTFIKTYTSKVLTEEEKKLDYKYNTNKKIITKTEFFKAKDSVGQFLGFIKNYECFMYDNESRLVKTIYYKSTIDTTDFGLEEMNEDYPAYKNGTKLININHIKYNFRPVISKIFNKKGQLEREVYLLELEGYDYFYDEEGNLNSYSKFQNRGEIKIWDLTYFDFESEIFKKNNLEGEYSIKFIYDQFGNWVEKTTFKEGYFYSKATRKIIYLDI
ncbi:MULTISPECIES: hypothetical protein [unclassified Flavobacterium]|uniref:hypothetical protein n=1 Tax=unclassified Flavobacterium TaxID=196869 RepID=UPI0012911506|nr:MULTISPECIES: hypothetical protein [unclassified Flavobacterium]MQP51472.1 hypothetical protein [Flavobacterium sp. LMO9]MQP61300.1 hypothetical protein [Flavobacterium sp. LMO6]